MSVFFTVSGTSIWNPASRVGVLYVDHLEAAARFVQMGSGVAPLDADEYDIDPIKLAALVQHLVVVYEGSNHHVLRSSLRSVISPGMVLVHRTEVPDVTTTDRVLSDEVPSFESRMPV